MPDDVTQRKHCPRQSIFGRSRFLMNVSLSHQVVHNLPQDIVERMPRRLKEVIERSGAILQPVSHIYSLINI
jgi:hypothetical protein